MPVPVICLWHRQKFLPVPVIYLWHRHACARFATDCQTQVPGYQPCICGFLVDSQKLAQAKSQAQVPVVFFET